MPYYVTAGAEVDGGCMPILTVSDSCSAHSVESGSGEWVRIYLKFISDQCASSGITCYELLTGTRITPGVFSVIPNLRLRKYVIEFSNKYYARWCYEYVREPQDIDHAYDELYGQFCDNCNSAVDCNGNYDGTCGDFLNELARQLRNLVEAPSCILYYWWDLTVCPNLDAHYAPQHNTEHIHLLDSRYV